MENVYQFLFGFAKTNRNKVSEKDINYYWLFISERWLIYVNISEVGCLESFID